MKTFDKFTQFAYIDRVNHPRYSTNDMLVDCNTVKWARTDNLKIAFNEVHATNEWAGQWYISRKVVMKCKKFDNNGRMCYVVSLNKLERFEITQQHSMVEIL